MVCSLARQPTVLGVVSQGDLGVKFPLLELLPRWTACALCPARPLARGCGSLESTFWAVGPAYAKALRKKAEEQQGGQSDCWGAGRGRQGWGEAGRPESWRREVWGPSRRDHRVGFCRLVVRIAGGTDFGLACEGDTASEWQVTLLTQSRSRETTSWLTSRDTRLAALGGWARFNAWIISISLCSRLGRRVSSYPYLDEKIEARRSGRESSRWPERLSQRHSERRMWGHPGDGERLGGGRALGGEAGETN